MVRLVWKVVNPYIGLGRSVVVSDFRVAVDYLGVDFDLRIEPLVEGSLLFAFDNYELAVHYADMLRFEVLLGLADVVEGPDLVVREAFVVLDDWVIVKRFWHLWHASRVLGVKFGELVALVDGDLYLDLVRVEEGVAYCKWFRALAFVGTSFGFTDDIGFESVFGRVNSICKLDCFLESLDKSLRSVGLDVNVDELVYDLDKFWEVLNG